MNEKNKPGMGSRLIPPEVGLGAEIGKRLGRRALDEVAHIVRPEIILSWHRRLVANKLDGSQLCSFPGRPNANVVIEKLILPVAREHRTWGFRRIVGARSNRGREVSHQTVGNVLECHHLLPAPERERKTSWREFIRTHTEVLAAVDSFAAEVWTSAGLITYYVLAFPRVGSRQVCIARMTPSPDQAWTKQMARNMTLADTGFLCGCKFLLPDRDTKFSSAFDGIPKAGGITVRSPCRRGLQT